MQSTLSTSDVDSTFEFYANVIEQLHRLHRCTDSFLKRSLLTAQEVHSNYTRTGRSTNGRVVGILLAWHFSTKEIIDIIDAYGDDLSVSEQTPLLESFLTQNQIFESKCNVSTMVKSVRGLPIRCVLVPTQATERHIDGFSDVAVNQLFSSMTWNREEVVSIPLHPYNTSDTATGHHFARLHPERVVEFGRELGFDLVARPTASRTLYVTGKDRARKPVAFAMKLPTNFIVDTSNSEDAQSKTKLTVETVLSSLRHEYIKHVDATFNFSPMILEECGALLVPKHPFDERGSEMNGFIVKSVRRLQQKWFIPAFAIPQIGKTISDYQLSKAETAIDPQRSFEYFYEFWGEHFARRLGQAEAMLLLRYGLQCFVPNPQNLLLTLDEHLMPGEFVFRDVSDLFFVESFLDAYDDLSRWKAREIELCRRFSTADRTLNYINRFIYLAWENSVMWFDLGPHFDKSSSLEVLRRKWAVQHIRGYVECIEKQLNFRVDAGFDASRIAELGRLTRAALPPSHRISEQDRAWLDGWKKDRRNYFEGVALDRRGIEGERYPPAMQHFHQEAYAMALTQFFRSAAGQEKLKKYRKSLTIAVRGPAA